MYKKNATHIGAERAEGTASLLSFKAISVYRYQDITGDKQNYNNIWYVNCEE